MKLVNNSVTFNPSSKKKPLDAFRSNLGMICSEKRKQQNPSFISLFSAVFLSVFNLDLPSAHRRTPTHFLPPPPPPPPPIFPSPYFTLLAHSYILHTAVISAPTLHAAWQSPRRNRKLTFFWWMWRRPPGFYLCPPPLVHLTSLILPLRLAILPSVLCWDFIQSPFVCMSFYFALSASCFPWFFSPADPGRCCASSAQHKHILMSVREHTHTAGRKPQHRGGGPWDVTKNGGRQLVYMHIYI